MCPVIRKRSIKSLYELQFDKRWCRLVRVYDEKSKTLVSAKVKEVFKTGNKLVYEMLLENGKRIKATSEHKFFTRKGFQCLSDLSIHDAVAINGVLAYRNKDWMIETKETSIQSGEGVQGIADRAGISYHTARKWLKVHGLSFTKKEVARYTSAWNKGLPVEEQPMFGKNHSDETRNKMTSSSRAGESSNLYRNGNSKNASFRTKVFQWQNKRKLKLLRDRSGKCAQCQSTDNLEIDHINSVFQHPEQAFIYDNLQLLCVDCHLTKTATEAKVLVGYSLIKSITLVGEEETYDMEIDHSSHNYVANGIITHNSQRYAKATAFEKYTPRRQDLKNRQNSIDDMEQDNHDWFDEAQKHIQAMCKTAYDDALDRGIAKECARFLLPLGTQTKLYMKGSVRSWIHYLQIRDHAHCQKEHRDIAQQIKIIFIRQFPQTSEALNWRIV